MNVAIVGGTLWGNRGAEAMVETAIGLIRERRPDARFTVLSYYPAQDRRLVRDERVTVVSGTPAAALALCVAMVVVKVLDALRLPVPRALTPGPVAAIRDADCLLDVSGIAFHDGRLAVVAYHLASVIPAMTVGVPVVRLSQALGPFDRRLNRWAARWTLRRTRLTFARGATSLGHLERLGLDPERWTSAPDLAFAFRDDMSLTRENDDRVDALARDLAANREDGPVVGLVPSSLVAAQSTSAGDDHVALLASWVGALVDKGCRVVVMPHATRAGHQSMRNNDVAVVEDLHSRLGGVDGVDFVDYDLNAAAIRRLIRHCDVLLTSRFHAMVGALAEGVIPVTVGWSHKYEEVLDVFGCGDLSVDYRAADDTVAATVLSVLRDPDRAEQVRTRRAQVARQAQTQVDEVIRLVAADPAAPDR